MSFWISLPLQTPPLYISQPTANLLILQDKFRENFSLDLKESTDISVPQQPLSADRYL